MNSDPGLMCCTVVFSFMCFCRTCISYFFYLKSCDTTYLTVNFCQSCARHYCSVLHKISHTWNGFGFNSCAFIWTSSNLSSCHHVKSMWHAAGRGWFCWQCLLVHFVGVLSCVELCVRVVYALLWLVFFAVRQLILARGELVFRDRVWCGVGKLIPAQH